MKYKQEYQNVWSQHNGDIPRTEKGSLYDIHHLNFDHNDNRLENLVCIDPRRHAWLHWQYDHVFPMQGKKHSDVTLKKMSLRQSGRNNPSCDKELYWFENIHTGQTRFCDRFHMVEEFGINVKSLFYTNPPSYVKGWVLLSKR